MQLANEVLCCLLVYLVAQKLNLELQFSLFLVKIVWKTADTTILATLFCRFSLNKSRMFLLCGLVQAQFFSLDWLLVLLELVLGT